MSELEIGAKTSPWRSKDSVSIGIIGSRNYPKDKYWLIENELMTIKEVWSDVYDLEKIIVISGGARGPDSEAVRLAKKLGLGVIEYKVDSKGVKGVFEFTLRAMARNGQIAESSDWVIAFWDGKSRGTLDTMRKAKKLGKKVDVITPTGDRVEWN